MIIDCEVDIKNYIENILNFFGFWKYLCPCCGSKKSLICHAKYERYIFLFENDIFVCHMMTILLLKFKSCCTTHAILPADVIPFKIFSFTCIRICLTGYFIQGMNGSEISLMYRLSVQMVYLFVKEFLDECQYLRPGILNDLVMLTNHNMDSKNYAVLILNGQALMSISQSNRLIGIISHVNELKEKIDHQIVVKKEHMGGSHAEIVI